MSQVLYRKYRPQTFAEVVGQEAVVAALSRAVQDGKPGHAYLFSGGRGTGKTSLARIFAKSLGVASHDVQEMDAASNRGVDDVRELNNAVHTMPLTSPYKVYIVDEVHMLTKEAFNALLKTLEEPPRHVIFILATTELDRVPETIRSRCQAFQFSEPTREMLADYVITVAQKEKIKITKEVADIIAKSGRGSFRDTLGILQSVFDTATDREITAVEALRVTGGANDSDVFEFLESIFSGTDVAWKLIDRRDKRHLDFFIEEIIETVRKILLFRYAPAFARELLVGVSPDYVSRIESLAGEKRINSEMLKQLLELVMHMKKTPFPEASVAIFLSKIQEGTSLRTS